MHFLEILVLILVLIASIITAILLSLVSNKITKIRGYDSSSKLNSIRAWYDWSSLAMWFVAILAAMITVIFLIQSSYSDIHRHNYGTNFFVKIALWLILVVLFIAILFLWLGYHEMRDSTVYTQRTDPDSTINTYLIASMIMIGASILLILIIIITTSFRNPKLHDDEKEYLAEQLQGDVETEREQLIIEGYESED